MQLKYTINIIYYDLNFSKYINPTYNLSYDTHMEQLKRDKQKINNLFAITKKLLVTNWRTDAYAFNMSPPP